MMRSCSSPFALLVAAAVVAASGCSPNATPATPSAAGTLARIGSSAGRPAVACAHTASTCIDHVIIVIQENRSFDNLFRNFPGSDSSASGLANCGGAASGTIALHPLRFESNVDPNHGWLPSIAAVDGGKMDGFCHNPDTPGTAPYAYVPNTEREAKPLWDIARNYVIADHLFPTQLGESFTAHLTLVAGNDEFVPGQEAIVDNPTSQTWGCDAPPGTTTPYIDAQRTYYYHGPFPCFTQFHTMADSLDAAGVSWKYYAPAVGPGANFWTAFRAISNVYNGSDWAKIVSPETTFLTDAQQCTASSCAVPNVAWVVPDAANSDHAGSLSATGPSWVASIVNTVHHNSYLWRTTAIVIVWDDWGGWYDHVPPPQSPAFGGTFAKGDFRGLGVRVPMLIVSPFTYDLRSQHRNVVHTQYEFGSILKFVEQVFHLRPLGSRAAGYTDRRAISIRNAFDFQLDPLGGTDIRAPYPASHFIHERPSLRPPDDY